MVKKKLTEPSRDKGFKTEELFQKVMKKDGYAVQKFASGIPDFIVYKDKKCFLAEVKSGKHSYHKHQEETAKLLKKIFKVTTKVYRYKNGKFIIERKI